MGKASKITLKSDISKEDMEMNFEEMLDESLTTAIGSDNEGTVDENDGDFEEREDVSSEADDSNPFHDADVHRQEGVSADATQKPFGSKTLEEKADDIYNEFIQDTTITLANIKDIAFREAAIKGRWCSRLMAERVRRRRLIQTLDTLVKELNEIADSKTGRNGAWLTGKRDMKSAIDSNAEVIALRKEISESNEIEKYLSDLNDCIKGLGYTVKNSLDVLNLERGI